MLAGSLLAVRGLKSRCWLGCSLVSESECTSKLIQALAGFSSRTEVPVSLLAVRWGPSELLGATLRS